MNNSPGHIEPKDAKPAHGAPGAESPEPIPSPFEPGILRTLIAVVFGYFTFAAVLALGLTLMLFALDTDSLFEPGVWRAGTGLQVSLVLLGGVGAFMGGAFCRPIGGSKRVVTTFALALFATVSVWLFLRATTQDVNATRGSGADEGAYFVRLAYGPIMWIGLPVVSTMAALIGGGIADRVQRGLLGR